MPPSKITNPFVKGGLAGGSLASPTVGEIARLLSAQGQGLRDLEGAWNFSGFFVHKGNTQSVTQNVATKLTFGAGPLYNVGGGRGAWDASNNELVSHTARDSLWLIGATMQVAAMTAAVALELRVRQSSGAILAQDRRPTFAGTNIAQVVSLLRLPSGARLFIEANHTDSTSRVFGDTTPLSAFWCLQLTEL